MYLLAALFKYTSALELARARLGESTKAVGDAGSLPRRIERAASHRGSTTNVAFRGHGDRACGGAGVHTTAPGGYRRR